jgi:hypothetical protein
MNKPNAPGEGSELPAPPRAFVLPEIHSTWRYMAAPEVERYITAMESQKTQLIHTVADLSGKVAKLSYEAALSSPQQEWIDCKQKLPPLLTPVWAWDGSDSVIRILTKNGWKASMGGAVYQISHWQPYSPPAPPVTAEGKDRG